MNWIEERWRDLTNIGSATWLAIALWVAVAVGVAALIYAHRQIKRNRELAAEKVRPHVGMFMEPNPGDWHIIELVVKNFGNTAAHNVRFNFSNPPTVARYENGYDEGHAELEVLRLPTELPVLAPGQEWRTMWDSALDRNELGDRIESKFEGTVWYYDTPADGGALTRRKRRAFETKVVLDWADLQPVQRLELMTAHDLRRQEKQKLELLRNLLTYFHYAAKETRQEVLQAEIDRINRAVEETQDRWRTRQLDETTDHETPKLDLRSANNDAGRHQQD
jgi:hypothetical protein